MRRRCDGTDEYLSRRIASSPDGAIRDVPCNCGLEFDDVYRSVIYPHDLVQPHLTDAQVDALIARVRGLS